MMVLAQLPVARLARARRGWAIAAGWTALLVAVALTARAQGAARGADHVLVDAYGALALPLVIYAIVGIALGGRSLSGATAPLVAFGAPPAAAAAVAIGVAVAACAGVAALLGAASAIVAHGAADPPVAMDAVTSAYAGALGGAAYASWFSLGAAFGRRGGGRTWFLVIDWVLGGDTSALAIATPRAHLRNLLGGAPPMDLSGRTSAVALVLLTAVAALLAVRRERARRF